MKISDRLLETAEKLREQGADGPFLFRMPTALARALLAELDVTHLPKTPAGESINTFEWNGHTILAEDNITVHAKPPQAANES